MGSLIRARETGLDTATLENAAATTPTSSMLQQAIEQSAYDDVVNRVASLAAKHVVGSGLDPATTLGPVISRRHKERVDGYIDAAENCGISVNSPGFPYPGLPEGGKKASGYGRDLGPESLDGYLHSKSVSFERS